MTQQTLARSVFVRYVRVRMRLQGYWKSYLAVKTKTR